MTRLIFALLIHCCLTGLLAADETQSKDDLKHFERKVRPVLAEHCYACHSAQAKTVHGGLRLDSSAALKRGGDSGAVIDPDHPERSLLLTVLRYDDDITMPPKGKLPSAAVREITRWVKRGAPMPAAANLPDRTRGIDFDAGRRFWSFQPAVAQPQPTVAETDWPRSRIDYFILAGLEQQGLSPSPAANRRTLIRRLSFDLVGLPPTPGDVEKFVSDPSPDAWEALVNRLLESPHYGEKWGRMWLDLARYTDRTASWLASAGQAYLYRDWVVRAFNDDMPYDEFVHRQMATDLMSQTGPDDLPALGFLALSPTYWKELKLPCEIINTIVADEWEERVDATTRTFLGLTVACARCHDHKYDPISSADYYGLAGVFASCRQTGRPLISEAEYEPVRKAGKLVATLEAKLTKLKQKKPPPAQKIGELTAKIRHIRTSTPRYDTPIASALSEESLFVVRAGKTAQDGSRLDYRPGARDLPLFVRGDPNRPGPIVPRRFLTVLSRDTGSGNQPRPLTNGSGRLDLAEAITSDAASLTARVIVNRIWQAHFGKGLVSTPSNFGVQGGRPSHPQLLDDLAARFMAGGWSIKSLHREILLSATWQQSSVYDATRVQADPENRWLSRMNRRRLPFESWRDAMLSAAGVLDRSVGGPSLELEQAKNSRRTIYATVHRRDLSATLSVHDFPDPTQHSPARTPTTTPLQGLYALNGPLLTRISESLAARLRKEIPDDDAARIKRAYQLLYSRRATEDDLEPGLRFLGDHRGPDRRQRWRQYAHVLLASNEMLYVD